MPFEFGFLAMWLSDTMIKIRPTLPSLVQMSPKEKIKRMTYYKGQKCLTSYISNSLHGSKYVNKQIKIFKYDVLTGRTPYPPVFDVKIQHSKRKLNIAYDKFDLN